jgi:hypothetical protein
MVEPHLTPVGGVLGSRALRYLVTVILHDVGRSMTVPEVVVAIESLGLRIPGRPSKTVSDALRWEIRKGRIRRNGRGRYAPGVMPPSTLRWIRRALQANAVA